MNKHKITILLVDDETQILNTYKAALRTSFDVLTANSCDEAVKLLQSNEIHVILVDYGMPDKDGILFLSEVLLTHPDITRILMTAHDKLTVAIEAINIGSIYRYVQKPAIMEELTVIIEQSYEFHKLKKENERLIERLMSNERLIRLLESKQ
jgi:DNA-binding NtrC family response regulator